MNEKEQSSSDYFFSFKYGMIFMEDIHEKRGEKQMEKRKEK